MTREEEIERASVHHLYQYDYSYEEGEHLDFYIKGFTEGAKWADEHPKNVWHDANEKPNCGSDVIALDHNNVPVYGTFKDDDDYGEYIYRCHGFSCEIFEYEYVAKWAYIKDLLPKGCEK